MADASKDGIILDKQWLETKDERTRDSHTHLDGEIRKWNERFSNGLRYPQDPQGEAGEVYNCRCAMREITRGFYNKYTGKTDMLPDAPQDEYAAESKAYWNKYFAEKKYTETELAAAENPNYSNKLLKNDGKNGIITNINTGGLSGAKKTEGWQERHAERMYEEIRHRTTDIDNISQNTEFSHNEVEKIKNHMFFNEYMLDGEMKRFDADYEQAQAWDRLSQGKGTEVDKELLWHELTELTEMQEHGLNYEEAHKIANSKHNWWKLIINGGE